MDQELHQNKRLREMFRLFQRTKKRGDKSSEASGTDEKGQSQWPKRKTPLANRVSSRSPPIAKSPTSKQRSDQKRMISKRQVSEDQKGGEEDEESPSAVDISASERKRRKIRKKYGIDKKDEEFFQRKTKDVEAEEFENVNAKFRPAATKMRKAKLRWKAIDKSPPPSSREMPKAEKSCADGSIADDLVPEREETSSLGQEDIDSTQQSLEESKPPTSKSIERLAKLEGQPQEKIDKLLREIHVLLSRVDHLEEEHRKAVSFIKKLRTRLSAREQKISELSKRIMHLERGSSSRKEDKGAPEEEKSASEERRTRKSAEEEKSTNEGRKTKSIDEERPSDAQIAVALRGLAIMKRNQILEQIVKPKEAKVLANFFEAEIPKPDQRVVMLIDKAFGYGIDVLLMRPDLFEDVVDNELRLFLLDTARAKRIFLDCILLHPEFVPIAWGGNVLTKRQQERQLQRQLEAKKAAQPTNRVENEKVRDASAPSPSKSFYDFLANTFGNESKEQSKSSPPEQPKSSPPVKPAEKSAEKVSERSDVKKVSSSKARDEKSTVEKKEPTTKSSREPPEKSTSDSDELLQPAWTRDRGIRVRRRPAKTPDRRQRRS